MAQDSFKHHVVVLEECHCALPKFDFPHTYVGYDNTQASQVAERIKNATIVISTIVPVTAADVAMAPRLRCLGIMATGMGWVDRAAYAARDVSVLNCPQSNIPAVSQHCIGLYFAVRKKIVELHRVTTETNEWARKGTLTKRWSQGPPLSCGDEILGIVGHGYLGQAVAGLARALGFKEVRILDRKGVDDKHVRQGRCQFEKGLKEVSVLVLCCPKDKDTVDLIGEAELKAMRKDAVLINMARGGIVNEAALAKALRAEWIAGAATDVLEVEPPLVGESPLLPDLSKGEKEVPNLTISPHISWFSVTTVKQLQFLLKEGIEGWVKGNPPKGSLVVHNGKVLK